MTKRRVVAAVGALLIASVASAEVVFRTLFFEQLKVRAYPEIYVRDARLGYRYLPNAKGLLRSPGILREFRTNSKGFVGPEFEARKKLGWSRIAIVGASIGSGIWQGTGLSYPALVQRLFDAADLPVEVINFSIDGGNRGLARLRLIESEIVGYQPDLILSLNEWPLARAPSIRAMHAGYVYSAGLLDLSLAEQLQATVAAKAYIDDVENHGLIGAYRRSFIVRAFCRWHYDVAKPSDLRGEPYEIRRRLTCYQTKTFRTPETVVQLGLDESIDRWLRTQEAVRRQGSELVVMLLPRQVKAAERMDRAGISRLTLDVPRGPEFSHELDAHLTGAGHELLARQLFDELLAFRPSLGVDERKR